MASVDGAKLGSAFSWSFDVDLSPPVVTGFTPAYAAPNAPLNGKVVFQFKTVLAPGYLTASNITYTRDYGGDPVQFSFSQSGNTVTVTPDRLLLRDAGYVVKLNGYVVDVLGNGGFVSSAASFVVDPGLFGAAVHPPYGSISSVGAAGDINGDWRDDTVVVVPDPSKPRVIYSLAVRLQKPDGTLADPVWIATGLGDSGCPPTSVAIGDIDGDGRKDVVVAFKGCGLDVFRQMPDGSLVLSNSLVSLQSNQVRLADFDRDGKLEILAIGWRDTQAALWHWNPGWTFSLIASPPVEYFGDTDLAIGDLNGDGRLDFAVSSRETAPDKALAVVLQKPDGTFAAPVYMTPNPAGAVRSVAIADFNGDGRQDLLVTFGGVSKMGIMLQQADGTLGPIHSFATYDTPTAFLVTDIDGDGRPDLVVQHGGIVGIFIQRPDGSLSTEDLYSGTGSEIGSFMLADLNGDGRKDLVFGGSFMPRLPPVVAASQAKTGAITLSTLQKAVKDATK